MDRREICLLNDAFPPLIDGVSTAVVNYARVLKKAGREVSVVTPRYPGADDSSFDYPVIRYPSLDLRKSLGYTAGNPFNIPTLVELSRRDIGLLHSHCPLVSNLLARSLRMALDVPLVMTYHTKFDVDFANALRSKALQAGAIKALIDSVSGCDEVWAVSEGAAQNLRQLGYRGDCVVMNNGVDVPRRRVSDGEVRAVTAGYDLPEDVPVFLFVGRLMWYKGLRIILDALAALKYRGIGFRFVVIGGGGDEKEVRQYAQELKLTDRVFFTGPVRDREKLAAWYCRADLFLFPSTFDTNGLVVREAAACSLGSVLVDGSCAAEGVRDGVDAVLIQENAASLAVCLAQLAGRRDEMREIGRRASENLYFSWDDAVARAMERYEIVLDNHRSGLYKKRRTVSDELFVLSGELVDYFAALDEKRREHLEKYRG